tara:strand:+ start:10340 stop:10891 length:552 start_codon:yes stop_codon:yes gene_type:complete
MLKNALKEHSAVFSNLSLIENDIIELYNMILSTIEKKGKVLIFGNGGSAADAQHFAAELVVKFEKKRQPIAAIALTTDTSIITSISNDLSFNKIFSRQIAAIANEEDLLIGISTSGKSQNVIQGLQIGKELNISTVLFTGENKLDDNFVDLYIHAPSDKTSRIQEVHLFVYHVICELIDEKFK